MVHISTAYSNAYRPTIEEKCYDPPTELEKLLKMASFLSKEEMATLTPSLLEKWPNTYTLTKAIAEYFVKKEEGTLPACIFRPAIGKT